MYLNLQPSWVVWFCVNTTQIMHIVLEKQHFRWLPFQEKGGVSSLSSRFPYTHRVFSGSTFWKKSWWREHHHLPHAEFPFPLLVLLRWFLPPNHDVTLLRGIHSYFAFSNKIIHNLLLLLSIDIINTGLLMIGWWKLWMEKVSEKLKVEIKLFGNIALRPMSRMEVVWVWRAITSRQERYGRTLFLHLVKFEAPIVLDWRICLGFSYVFAVAHTIQYHVKEDWRFFPK